MDTWLKFAETFALNVSGKVDPNSSEKIADILIRNFKPSYLLDRFLGSGDFGTAVLVENRRTKEVEVIKLTTDAEEAAVSFALKLELDGMDDYLDHVIAIYDVRQVDDVELVNWRLGASLSVFLIRMELLDRVGLSSLVEKATLNSFVKRIKKEFQVMPSDLIALSRQAAKSRLVKASVELARVLDESEIQNLKEIAVGLRELHELKIYTVDPHSGNIGFTEEDGLLKLFDLGVSIGPKLKKTIKKIQNPRDEGWYFNTKRVDFECGWPVRPIHIPRKKIGVIK